MKKIIMLGLLMLPAFSSASNWVDLGKTSDNQYQSFLDVDSIMPVHVNVLGDRHDAKYISAVLQGTYINDNPSRKNGEYYVKTQLYIDCEQNTFFINSYITYGFKNEVLDSGNSNKSVLSLSDFQYAFPDTIAQTNVEMSCYAADNLF